MELPIRMIVILAMAVLVLVVVTAFFLLNMGPQANKAQAQKIFQDSCFAYSQKGCGWEVTEEASFNQFVAACKIVYGDNREAFSCLYSLCPHCSSIAQTSLRCAGLCSGIEGQSKLGANVEESCRLYKSDQGCSKVSCAACA